jgi:triosephosphate isomerase
MSRKPIVAANWKMNLDRSEAIALATEIAAAQLPERPQVVVCPPFPWLDAVKQVIEGSAINLGAQDCSENDDGAFTGQVSARMLAENCTHVIVGHSERRRDACESNETVARKALSALGQGLTPIVCVGESLDQREVGEAAQWVAKQITPVIETVGSASLARCVIAYEPIWAIGTGRSAQPADAEGMARAIRSRINRDSAIAAETVRILYGGSVTVDNASEILRMENIDGLLVGGASLISDTFIRIASAV